MCLPALLSHSTPLSSSFARDAHHTGQQSQATRQSTGNAACDLGVHSELPRTSWGALCRSSTTRTDRLGEVTPKGAGTISEDRPVI